MSACGPAGRSSLDSGESQNDTHFPCLGMDFVDRALASALIARRAPEVTCPVGNEHGFRVGTWEEAVLRFKLCHIGECARLGVNFEKGAFIYGAAVPRAAPEEALLMKCESAYRLAADESPSFAGELKQLRELSRFRIIAINARHGGAPDLAVGCHCRPCLRRGQRFKLHLGAEVAAAWIKAI